MDRRYLNVLLVLLLLVIYFFGQSYGSRHTLQVFKVQPKAKALPPNFFGFMPKAMPIPPSGPSRKHNDIGFQSSMGEGEP
ncbi:IDA 2 [Spatholobus suberectus]|nr:IDA 2 [Spatholobus suberectus]